MAKIDFAHKAQRKMFEAILDSVIKHSNSDRTKAIKQLVDLVKKRVNVFLMTVLMRLLLN